jgi:hypothetical protein
VTNLRFNTRLVVGVASKSNSATSSKTEAKKMVMEVIVSCVMLGQPRCREFAIRTTAAYMISSIEAAQRFRQGVDNNGKSGTLAGKAKPSKDFEARSVVIR